MKTRVVYIYRDEDVVPTLKDLGLPVSLSADLRGEDSITMSHVFGWDQLTISRKAPPKPRFKGKKR